MKTTNSQSPARAVAFGAELERLIGEAIERRGGEFETQGKTPAVNVVVNFTPAGLWVATKKATEGQVPQLIPAWMFVVAWQALRERGSLSNKALLSELKVMRSSAVCAILATLPGVRVVPGAGIVLAWVGKAAT